MIARVTNAAKLAFVHLNWSNDHMTARCSKSKKDQEGKRAFPMAFMANRYMWTICPITALAIWFSVTTFLLLFALLLRLRMRLEEQRATLDALYLSLDDQLR